MKMLNVLMIGVDKDRVGGMWTVAETFITNEEFNKQVNLKYIATSTGGSLGRRLKKMLMGYVAVFKELAFGKVDIVHVHMAERGSVYRKGALVYLAKLFGAKTVIQMHAGPIMMWYEQLSDFEKKGVKRILAAPDKMLVLGEFWIAQMAKLIPAKKIEVLYNGLDCPENNTYNLNGKDILFMGLLKKEKGVFDLIDAVDRIDAQLSADTKVYLCGVAEDGTVESYIANLKSKERFILAGWIGKEQKEELFKTAQMSVLPSYAEALSMTVIESMCHGVPMVTTKITTMPELLGDEVEMVNPGDVEALSRLILKLNKDVALRKRISEIEFARVQERFSVYSVMNNVLRIYEDL